MIWEFSLRKRSELKTYSWSGELKSTLHETLLLCVADSLFSSLHHETTPSVRVCMFKTPQMYVVIELKYGFVFVRAMCVCYSIKIKKKTHTHTHFIHLNIRHGVCVLRCKCMWCLRRARDLRVSLPRKYIVCLPMFVFVVLCYFQFVWRDLHSWRGVLFFLRARSSKVNLKCASREFVGQSDRMECASAQSGIIEVGHSDEYPRSAYTTYLWF